MALRIMEIVDEIVTEIRYLNAGPGGRPVGERLPVLRGTLAAPGCSDELDAIIACSDLQGIVRGRGDVSTLLGVAVAEALEELAFDGVLPRTARTGVILAGDLYSVPGANKRGGRGDVADVWAAFAGPYAWVAGVGGNHDDVTKVAAIGDVHLLDGDVVALDGVRIGGVGGIIGDPGKPMRRSEEAFLALIDRSVDAELDLLVLHAGPHGDDGQRGHPAIRAAVEAGGVGLVICGHCHWDVPLAEHESGQILNVDARVVVLDVRR